MCGAPTQGQTLPAGVDVEKETVITGRVLAADGQPVGGAFVRLLDGTGEFTAEVVASGTGDFRFFAAPGDVDRACAVRSGNGSAEISPEGSGHPQRGRRGRRSKKLTNGPGIPGGAGPLAFHGSASRCSGAEAVLDSARGHLLRGTARARLRADRLVRPVRPLPPGHRRIVSRARWIGGLTRPARASSRCKPAVRRRQRRRGSRSRRRRGPSQTSVAQHPGAAGPPAPRGHRQSAPRPGPQSRACSPCCRWSASGAARAKATTPARATTASDSRSSSRTTAATTCAWESRSWVLDAEGKYIRPGPARERVLAHGRRRHPRQRRRGSRRTPAHPQLRRRRTVLRPARCTQSSWELATDVVIRSQSGHWYGGAKRLYGIVEGGDLAYVEERILADGALEPRLSARLHPLHRLDCCPPHEATPEPTHAFARVPVGPIGGSGVGWLPGIRRPLLR